MNKSIILFLLYIFPIISLAQLFEASKYKGFIESQVGMTNKDVVPFWMRSNQFGSIPATGLSNSWLIGFQKNLKQIESTDFSSFDWGLNFESRVNLAGKSTVDLIEGNLNAKWWIFEGKMGRSKDLMGLNGDSTLSSGNFSISGNSLGIPKMEVIIPNFYRIPVLDGLISIKGNFALGYIGKTRMNPGVFLVKTENHKMETFYHQKSLYGRIGRENWKIKLYGGINHQAFWGSEKQIYGDEFSLSNFGAFYYVFFGKAYSSEFIGSSKIGNHLGSIDLSASINLKNVKIIGYRQNFYDVGAISKLANIRDGLNGISIENLKFNTDNSKLFRWKKVLVEYFYSKDQAGYPWSITTASGDEDYYNNSYYLDGWTYKGLGLGSPLIIPSKDAKEGQVYNPIKYYISNRVSAIHVGFDINLFQTNLLLKGTYSKHFGTFSTSPWGGSSGKLFEKPYGLFKQVDQFSFYLNASRSFRNNYTVGLIGSADYGQMFSNSFGTIISVRKEF